jgi:hypothetical protein
MFSIWAPAGGRAVPAVAAAAAAAAEPPAAAEPVAAAGLDAGEAAGEALAAVALREVSSLGSSLFVPLFCFFFFFFFFRDCPVFSLPASSRPRFFP